MKKKTLLTSLLTIAMCLALIAGSTYALFTSEDEVNIAVSSGKVQVEAIILENTLATSSLGVVQTVAGTFANGGSALFTDSVNKELELTNITPGDKVDFQIQITNTSSVKIQYRLTWAVEGELYDALVATADGKKIENNVTSWTEWGIPANGSESKTIEVSIELPAEFETQGLKAANISFKIEAVQANGTELYGKTVVSDLAGLQTALADTTDANIVAFAETLVIDKEVSLDLNGKTIEGDFELVEGAVVTMSNGNLDNNNPDVSSIQVNGGTLTLNNVNIESSRHCIRVEGDGAKVEINGGTYQIVSSGKTQHAVNVGEGSNVCEVIINGGTFIGPKGTAADSGSAVNVKENSTVTINGGNFSGGKNSTLSSKGTLIVKGGIFDQPLPASAVVPSGYRSVQSGSAYVVVPDDTIVGNDELNNAIQDAIQNGEKEITVGPGTYEFPSNMNIDGLTIIGQEGVVFEDTLSGSLTNTTIKNVHIKAGNAQRWAYSNGTLLFENCTFEATSVYAIHYDGLNGANITYKNCKIIGWVAIGGGAEHITFDGCEIYGNGTYGLIRLYSPGTIKNCTFDVSAVNTTDIYQDGIHAVDCNIDLSNNTNVNGKMVDIYNISGTGTLTVDGKIYLASADSLRAVANAATEDVEIVLFANITLGNDEIQKSSGAYFPNAKNVTIDGNGYTLTLKGPMTGSDWQAQYYAGIVAPNAVVTVKNVTIVNEKLSNKGTQTSADRAAVYTLVRGTETIFKNVNFVGGVQAKNNTKFVECTFVETVLTKNDAGYATDGRFCVFIDHQYTADGAYEFTFEGCEFDASGYGCVKVAGDKGANITVNVEDCSFTNTCPSNNWSQNTPKYDIKMTGANITVNDLGGNDWSDGANAGFGKG